IVSDAERDAALADIARDDDVRTLVVRIDSPGGTVVGGEALHDALRRVARAKPVVAVMAELATSAAYMTALGADRIFARQGTITGSIGVIWQTADVSELLGELGIRTEALRSGPLKARPSPLEPMTGPVRQAAQGLVDEMQTLFIALVAERRGLDQATVRRLADGRVYSGQAAAAGGLIDAIGGESEARDWLAAEHGIDADLPTAEVTWGAGRFSPLGTVLGLAGKSLLPETLILDGLVSLWHP
ncbi:MAG: signal peptide peptidase SppA, partial [Alphaproteobacteria bacterium]